MGLAMGQSPSYTNVLHVYNFVINPEGYVEGKVCKYMSILFLFSAAVFLIILFPCSGCFVSHSSGTLTRCSGCFVSHSSGTLTRHRNCCDRYGALPAYRPDFRLLKTDILPQQAASFVIRSVTTLWKGRRVAAELLCVFVFFWEILKPSRLVSITHLLYFFIIKPTRCTNFTNLFWHETLHVSGSSSIHYQEFIHCTLSSGICHTGLYTAFEQDHPRPDCRLSCVTWSRRVNTGVVVWSIPRLKSVEQNAFW
jgi:hypothetical protein